MVPVLVVLVHAWCFAVAVEQDCSEDGTCRVPAPEPRVMERREVTATFSNEGNTNLDLFWINEGKETLVVNVPAGSTRNVNTFTGHKFAMRTNDVEPKFVEVTDDTHQFTLGGEDGVVFNVENLEGKTALPAKLRNKGGQDLQMWYESLAGDVGIQLGVLHSGKTSETTAYPGNVFCLSKIDDPEGCRNAQFKLTIEAGKFVYDVDDGTGTPEIKSKWDARDAFNEEYNARTGRDWIAFWPRSPVKQYMHPVEKVGDVIQVNTSVPPQHAHAAGIEQGVLTLKVLCLEPRVFLVPNLLSEQEADHLVSVGSTRVKRSTTGNGKDARNSDTRTSRNTWIEREESEITERLYKRAAELANVSDKTGFEKLQLVHYGEGHKYAPHYDWQSTSEGSRAITLLLYLNDPAGGGFTSFPQAVPPMKVHPGKGGAVMFYNLLPDGNADFRALHSGMPVRHGEKWLANFWIWDPPEAKAR